MSYSRGFEREADAGIALLRLAGRIRKRWR